MSVFKRTLKNMFQRQSRTPTNEGDGLYRELQTEVKTMDEAREIVNEFGRVLTTASDYNKLITQAFFERDIDFQTKALSDEGVIFHQLQNRYDIRLLPFDKDAIKEAILLLLEYESDKKKRDALEVGLIYLDDFMDFSSLKP